MKKYVHLFTIDQKNKVGIATVSQVGTEEDEIVVKDGETMTTGAEIVTGIMIAIVPAVMNQEVAGGHARDQESMIVIGISG